MVESTIDKIKDITVERQIRKLAGIIDEQNDTISKYGDASSEIETLKTNDAKQTADITNLNNTVAPIPAQIQLLIDTDANQATQINNLKSDVAKNTTATENLNNRVTTVEQDITNTESEITTIKSTITNIQSKDVAQDGTLATHSEQIQGITESLISDVQILDGTTTGEIKVRIARESAAAIDSNSYNLGLPVSAEIIQGTGPSMFKVQITMSSGVKVVSNDFVFTTEAIGNDVYISSFTFKAGSQSGYLSADIGLNNGVTIEANNFLVPTDPNVIANITDLQTRMTNVEDSAISDSRITAIETKNTEQDTKISELEAKNTSQDTAIQKNATDISSLNTEVSGVMSDLNTKANLTNPTQTIKADTTDLRTVKLRDSSDAVSSYLQFNAASDKPVRMEYFNGSEVVDSGYIATIDDNGNPKNFSAGNEVWEEIDLTNLPTDWVEGDKIRIQFKCVLAVEGVSSWNTVPNPTKYVRYDLVNRNIITHTVTSSHLYGVHFLDDVTASTQRGFLGFTINYLSKLNTKEIGYFITSVMNGAGSASSNISIDHNNVSRYINKMWRLKK